MLAENNFSWSNYIATLAVAHRPWHVAEQISKSLTVGKSEHSLACHA